MIKEILVVKFDCSYYTLVKFYDKYVGTDIVLARRCIKLSADGDWYIIFNGEHVNVQNEVYRYETKEANNQELQKFWKEHH